MELLINASNHWTGDQEAAGSGSSWQMVCNLTKSRKGGIGAGGLLEGEPRSSAAAWRTYQHWILSGAQEAVAKPKPGGHGTSSNGCQFQPLPRGSAWKILFRRNG
jgi:hypothetical protein